MSQLQAATNTPTRSTVEDFERLYHLALNTYTTIVSRLREHTGESVPMSAEPVVKPVIIPMPRSCIFYAKGIARRAVDNQIIINLVDDTGQDDYNSMLVLRLDLGHTDDSEFYLASDHPAIRDAAQNKYHAMVDYNALIEHLIQLNIYANIGE